MGWGYGVIDGKEVGYTVDAVCEHLGCEEEIDRGLSYACGGFPGENDVSCNGFFCDEHLYYCEVAEEWVEEQGGPHHPRICAECKRALEEAEKENE